VDHRSAYVGPERAMAELEVLRRLGAAGVVIEALTTGKWFVQSDVVSALGRLVASAERWAERAEAA
jgi:hypothetical protein